LRIFARGQKPVNADLQHVGADEGREPEPVWKVELRQAQADQNDRSSKRENSAID
jgi:hypothetical protein